MRLYYIVVYVQCRGGPWGTTKAYRAKACKCKEHR
jgi:hypothetical protein